MRYPVQELIKEQISDGILKRKLDSCHSSVPSGKVPVWISISDMKDFKKVLPHLEDSIKDQEVIAICNVNSLDIKEFCLANGWIHAKASDVIGTETSVIVVFGIPSLQNLEPILSRARNGLFIITDQRWYVLLKYFII